MSEGVWMVSGVSRGCLDGVWMVSGWCLDGVWMVFQWCLDGISGCLGCINTKAIFPVPYIS